MAEERGYPLPISSAPDESDRTQMALCPNVKVLAKADLSVFVLTSRAGVRRRRCRGFESAGSGLGADCHPAEGLNARIGSLQRITPSEGWMHR